jgi:hypothetical protein
MKLPGTIRSALFHFAAVIALAAPWVARAADVEKAAPLAFIRTTELQSKLSAIDTLSAEYRPASGGGASVWLIGVSHLGTREYYKALQQRLDCQTVVLYEGIDGDKMKSAPGEAANADGVQSKLAKALGLAFQLDAIDYRRKHFINSDVTRADLAEQITKQTGGAKPKPETPGKGGAGRLKPGAARKAAGASAGSDADDQAGTGNESFDALMQAMEGKGGMGEMMNTMTAFIGSSPEMRETTKVMLVEVIGHAGEMLELAKNASPDLKSLFEVVLAERNEVLFRNLRAQLAKLKPGESVAVFYGAAHMDEIERRLRDELHYSRAKQEWDTAFTADPAKSAMPPAQIHLIIEMMKAQVKPQKNGGQ